MNISIVPLFIILFIFFKYINNSTHKTYFHKSINKSQNNKLIFNKYSIRYFVILFFTGILLFFIGNLLGNTLENLCKIFKISENFIGILLGFITSIPELITFYESQKHHKKKNCNVDGVIEATNNLLFSNILNLFIIQTIGIILLYLK